MATAPGVTKPSSQGGPESPTTARPLDLDDDDVQESGVLGGGDDQQQQTTTAPTPASAAVSPSVNAGSTTTAADAPPPPKPPRPTTEQEQNQTILKEAFPSVELPVIKAILTASGGRIDRAFNALLEMTDPDAAKQEPRELPPPQPPRPAGGAQPLSQLEADELYARQLAEHYENVGAYEARTTNRDPDDHRPRRRQQTGLSPDSQDRERNFFDDDLPVIQERLRQGFIETQGKVNTWFTGLKKRFDEEFGEEQDGPQRPGQQGGRRPGDSSRRSGDYDRYDADPQVLSDDFAGMRFAGDGTPLRENRQSANPDLYRPPPPSKSPKPDGRKVAFKETPEDIDIYGSSPRIPTQDSAGSATKAKPSKWQPLSSVEPNPITDNDPFSLGDSEDEKEAKDKPVPAKEIKMDDNERLKQAAAEAMADNLVEPKPGEQAGAAAAAKKD